MNEMIQLSALELAEQIKQKHCIVSDALRATLQCIEERESSLHCYLTLRDRNELLMEAESIQQRINCGELTGPLAGVPIAIKDNLCTKGIKTTCASRMLADFIPPYSADAIERIQQAGLLILGKTNMDEFGMGSTTEHSAFLLTKNPYDLSCVPGGSSGGSCAAVAAGEAFLALGTDTGGSIRQPSAYCGVYGLKPSYGAVSRYGLIAYASSMDQIGPIAKTPEDCAALLEILNMPDDKDATSLRTPLINNKRAISQLRIGIPKEFLESAGSDVQAAISSVSKLLKERNATVEIFSLNLTDYLLPAYYIIACAEASSNLARYDGVKYGYRTKSDGSLHEMYCSSRSEAFGKEVQRRILLGTFVLSEGYYDAYYLKALKAKRMITEQFDTVFQSYDLLLMPVTNGTAPKISSYATHPLSMYEGDYYTVAANLAGLPALSLPFKKAENGLPLGVQLMGPRGADYTLLNTATELIHS